MPAKMSSTKSVIASSASDNVLHENVMARSHAQYEYVRDSAIFRKANGR